MLVAKGRLSFQTGIDLGGIYVHAEDAAPLGYGLRSDQVIVWHESPRAAGWPDGMRNLTF